MSFSGNMLRGVNEIIGKLVAGIISLLAGAVALPILEFYFAVWIDQTFGPRFWVIFCALVIPTVAISVYIAEPLLRLIWILISSPMRRYRD
jgi:hypothetical protein